MNYSLGLSAEDRKDLQYLKTLSIKRDVNPEPVSTPTQAWNSRIKSFLVQSHEDTPLERVLGHLSLDRVSGLSSLRSVYLIGFCEGGKSCYIEINHPSRNYNIRTIEQHTNTEGRRLSCF